MNKPNDICGKRIIIKNNYDITQIELVSAGSLTMVLRSSNSRPTIVEHDIRLLLMGFQPKTISNTPHHLLSVAKRQTLFTFFPTTTRFQLNEYTLHATRRKASCTTRKFTTRHFKHNKPDQLTHASYHNKDSDKLYAWIGLH